VVAIRAQVKEAKSIVDDQPAERVQVTSAINPNRQALEKDLFTAQASLSSVQGQISGLKAQRKLALEESSALNDKEIQLAELRRDVEAKETNFHTYTEKLEQARINRSMEKNQLSNVNIAQGPSLSEKPTAPNRVLLLGLGIIAACCTGVGVAFLADQLARTTVTSAAPRMRDPLPAAPLTPIPAQAAHTVEPEPIAV
jgi:uncharacterized protein involved in exopolysaccharide biosynthesis